MPASPSAIRSATRRQPVARVLRAAAFVLACALPALLALPAAAQSPVTPGSGTLDAVRDLARQAGERARDALTGERAQDAGATLTIHGIAGGPHEFTTARLLARPDARTITLPADPAYGPGPRDVRAVPLAALLGDIPRAEADIVEATALDGFVAQLPAARVLARGPDAAEAWLAIEDPAAPWPDLPGKDVGAGPFYVVWLHPERSGIRPEAWPYQTVRLAFTESVAARFPAIAVDPALPADAPARAGQALFVENCFACHAMNGQGEATKGPDLNLPMNPTDYFRAEVLPAYLRDPKSVRHWPDQQMPAFPPDVLSDGEIAAVIAYLEHMAGRKAR